MLKGSNQTQEYLELLRRYLAAEHMEVVDRGGAVDDLPVRALDLGSKMAPSKPSGLVHGGHNEGIFVRHLEEALNAC
jgi:hypothetical protein